MICIGGGSAVKKPLALAGDTGLIPGSRRSHGEGKGNLLQYSCLGNSMDRGAWQTADHGVEESDTINSNKNSCIIDLQCCVSSGV